MGVTITPHGESLHVNSANIYRMGSCFLSSCVGTDHKCDVRIGFTFTTTLQKGVKRKLLSTLNQIIAQTMNQKKNIILHPTGKGNNDFGKALLKQVLRRHLKSGGNIRSKGN